MMPTKEEITKHFQKLKESGKTCKSGIFHFFELLHHCNNLIILNSYWGWHWAIGLVERNRQEKHRSKVDCTRKQKWKGNFFFGQRNWTRPLTGINWLIFCSRKLSAIKGRKRVSSTGARACKLRVREGGRRTKTTRTSTESTRMETKVWRHG